MQELVCAYADCLRKMPLCHAELVLAGGTSSTARHDVNSCAFSSFYKFFCPVAHAILAHCVLLFSLINKMSSLCLCPSPVSGRFVAAQHAWSMTAKVMLCACGQGFVHF